MTVGRWVEEGKLPYFTTGGGNRRVWEEDLVKFLKAHNYPIPRNLKSSLRPVVLIVEDEASVRRFIRRTLEKELPDIEIEEAIDGYEAGEKISSLVPSVVILDVNLPGVDGFKICEHIRLNKSLKNVKVLSMTGDSDVGIREKILKAGADDFLAKPFDGQALVKAVKKLVGVVK